MTTVLVGAVGQHQPLLIGPLGTNFSKTSIEIHAFPFNKMHKKGRLENAAHFVLASVC